MSPTLLFFGLTVTLVSLSMILYVYFQSSHIPYTQQMTVRVATDQLRSSLSTVVDDISMEDNDLVLAQDGVAQLSKGMWRMVPTKHNSLVFVSEGTRAGTLSWNHGGVFQSLGQAFTAMNAIPSARITTLTADEVIASTIKGTLQEESQSSIKSLPVLTTLNEISIQDGEITLSAFNDIEVGASSLSLSSLTTNSFILDGNELTSGGTSEAKLESFTTPGTYTWHKPSTASFLLVLCYGGGGGGFWASTGSTGGGGGACTKIWLRTSELNDTETVVVGAGGLGGKGTDLGVTRAATSGGTSSFGSYKSSGGLTGNASRGGEGGGAFLDGKSGCPALRAPRTDYATFGGTSWRGARQTSSNSYTVFAVLNAEYGGGSGGSPANNGGTPTAVGSASMFGGGGGGCGGAYPTGDPQAGKDGGASGSSPSGGGGGGAGGANDGSDGAKGADAPHILHGGAGGGGGGAKLNDRGGNGGDGGFPGGGGGGAGGVPVAGMLENKCGDGGNGAVYILTW